MKSLMSLWRVAADELAARCHTSTTLDYKKLERRVKEEGLAFLAITLPSYARDFERSLDAGSIFPGAFRGFSARRGLRPKFLGGFLERIFDDNGVLLPEPCIDSIFAVRQLTLMFGKIETPCSDARVDRAMRGYLEVEEELRERQDSIPVRLLLEFERMSLFLWGDAFANVDREIYEGRVIPRHGPGSTADRLLGNQKWTFPSWNTRLESVFAYGEYCLPSWRYYDQLDHVKFFEPGAEQPVKVITVPKTLKTPRIIAVEPTHMQYMQQGVARALIHEIEKEGPTASFHKASAPHLGFVGFKSQEKNRSLAREGSQNGLLATLDLSEASDRVLNGHVELLFKHTPWLNEAVQATRSLTARVPGGMSDGRKPVTVTLAKFASMGSALCFPVEALVFTTVIFCAIQAELKTPLTREMLYSFRDRVRVYGDDIVVPVEYVSAVIRYLEAFGLKVNSDKSFWTGKFRESCGGDFYDGEWVTPVRVRREFPRTLRDVHEVVSLVELRNRFYWTGMWRTAAHLDEIIVPLLKGHFPILESTSSGLGRESVLPYQGEKICAQLHRPLVRAWRMVAKPPSSPLDGVAALLKCLSQMTETPFEDPSHLERSGRPVAVDIKLRWSPPY